MSASQRYQNQAGLIELDATEIHLWLAFYEEIADAVLIAAYRSLLSEEERRQEGRFHFARDRRRYLVTRALVRSTLSRYQDRPPGSWRFSQNAYGRPEIADAAPGGRDLIFNLSHTDGLIVFGVTRSRALGVDVENIQAREVSVEIADRFFSPAEAAALRSVPNNRIQSRFWEYWTFKESYIKARGMGLSIPLDKFGFRYPHERGVAIEIQPELADRAARWQFWQFRPDSRYLAAVCAERIGLAPPAVRVRTSIPLASERTIEPLFTRTSW
jgi:4'-phosphopantetheinyl transferase